MMDYPRWSAARQASLRAVNNLGSPAWLAGAALLTFAAPWILRNAAFFEEGSGALVIVHLVIELFSVCIAVLVVVTAWNAFLEADRHAVHPLILGFTVMAGLDLLHALSYVGMPDFGSPASTEKAIFFWFMARAFDLLTFWLLALRIPLPGKRWHWLTVALCLQVLLPLLLGQNNPLVPPLLIHIVDQLAALFPDQRQQLALMRNKLAWKSIVQPAR